MTAIEEASGGKIREASQTFLKKEKGSAGKGGTKILSAEREWRDSVLPETIQLLYQKLIDAINQECQFPAEIAEPLLEKVSGLPLEQDGKANMLIAAGYSCGFGAPEAAYRAIMDGFRIRKSGPSFFKLGERVYEPSPQHMLERCPVCGGGGTPYYTSSSYLMGNYGAPFEPAKIWMKCRKCQNLFTKYYPESFYFTEEIRQELLQPRTDQDCISMEPPHYITHWNAFLKHIRQYQPKKKVLEIGIGTGEFIACALEMGYEVQCVELIREDAQKIADVLGIPIWNCDFLRFETSEKFPLITMGDVIEHVTSPKDCLLKAYRLLEDDGILWVSTPNYQGSFTRLRKFSNAMWMEPYHVSWFSRDGLEKLAEECGFEVLDYAISSHYNGSMELTLRKKQV
ncbi:MAG: class I SAM-dependent methyltransferase [Blautia sp.]|nr:class I SAM-dependent methyltransferase [Blautia sp.]